MERNTDHSSYPTPAVARHRVYLAFGSNLGDRRQNLVNALRSLHPIVAIDRTSSLYESEPVGYTDQPRFLNMACSGETDLSPEDLLHALKELEITLGRRPSFRNGPRLIDIDILLYDDLCLQQDDLIIPHPRMHERAFVLIPLVEIAPERIHPTSGKTIQALLGSVSRRGIKKVGQITA
ncbi:MAG: 2-amino-4-hydroxy-6-hydroxymethyldihydropteridine diphosphokinase [Ktedonobacteraceae bacterium]|nr:2-amino-4-hydroxy-6-hydroxymethyldihydropteridine diphosphokinase [Ktedonobacteraceae bacterium]